MVGSSASATSVFAGCVGGGGGGMLTSTCFGGGGIAGVVCAGGGGGGGGGGAVVCCTGGGGGGLLTCGGGGGALACGREPVPPGMNEKSSASEDEIHGTCSLREARVTPTRVRFSVSSAGLGTRISLSSSCTNRL